jgi:transcriptional regulator with XRE-family HTH domain
MKRSLIEPGQTRGMPTVQRARDRGRQQGRLLVHEIGSELREARQSAGVSQEHVARVAGLSQSAISRVERASPVSVRVDELARHSAALGLRLSLRLYPEGEAVRDAGQLRLLRRFRGEIGGGFGWRTEVPVAGAGDARAWDVLLDGPGTVGVDAETRLRDVQAVQRRCELKWRDAGVDRLVLVLAATRHNRAVLREHRAALSSTFPADSGEVMAFLRRGRLPPRNGIVVL